MSNWAGKLVGWIAALGAIVVMYFRGQALHEKSLRAQEHADNATARARMFQRIHRARNALQTKQQRQEHDDDADLDAGRRNHFDRDWH